MKRVIISIISIAILIGTGFSAYSQVITTIAEINQVDAEGNPTFPGLKTMDKYTIEGIVISAPGIFNGVTSSGSLDRSFILFMQDNTGGIQVYSGAWYGGGLSAYAEFENLRPGHLIRVTGLTGSFGGKTNINERHNPDQKFTIEVTAAAPIEPVPMAIETLAGLNDFDPTRKTGGEYYQGRLVVLKNVHIVDGEWGSGAKLTVADAQGNPLVVELRAGTGIGDYPQPQGTLDIIGVFNQEDSAPPATGGYLLWPRSIADFRAAGSSAVEVWDVYN